MHKRSLKVFIAPLLILLCFNHQSYAGNNYNTSGDGVVAGLCFAGAAVLGAIGAVALADWCFSETDEQMIARVEGECHAIASTYADAMNYFASVSGMSNYLLAQHKPFYNISELVLYEFATNVWKRGMYVSAYFSELSSVKTQLHNSVQKLRDRIHVLQGKRPDADIRRKLQIMHRLLAKAQELSSHIVLFADSLEYHKTYFNVYDKVGVLRNGYAQYFAIGDSGAHPDVIAYNLKHTIIISVGGLYPFRTFVNTIESDIAQLKSTIRAMVYSYPSGRSYANLTLDQLIWMKNAVITDSRYAQELYEWEQARLQRLQVEALEVQARAEQQRVWAIQEQNRVLERRNRIEEEKMWQRARSVCDNAVTNVNIHVSCP